MKGAMRLSGNLLTWLLSCFIAFFAYSQSGAYTYDLSYCKMHKSEISKLLFAKCIFIINPSVDINCGSSMSQLRYFRLSQWAHNKGFGCYSSLRNYCLGNKFRGRYRRKIRSKWEFLNTNMTFADYIICGCLSRVFNGHGYYWTISRASNLCPSRLMVCWGVDRISNIINRNIIYKKYALNCLLVVLTITTMVTIRAIA